MWFLIVAKLLPRTCFIFDNFFNYPTLISKQHERGLYDLGTVCVSHKEIPEMKKDKQLKRTDH